MPVRDRPFCNLNPQVGPISAIPTIHPVFAIKTTEASLALRALWTNRPLTGNKNRQENHEASKHINPFQPYFS